MTTRNVLSLNGLPIARITKGESVTLVPKRSRLSRWSKALLLILAFFSGWVAYAWSELERQKAERTEIVQVAAPVCPKLFVPHPCVAAKCASPQSRIA